MRPSITRLAALAACLGVAALPAAADASGYHMSRDFSANGDEARAYGKLCDSGSKFGKWRWKATVGEGRLRVSYRWTEPVYRDGKARHLNFTYVDGPLVDEQDEDLRPMFVASVKRVLNKITVRYDASKNRLVYKTPTGGGSSIAFKPGRGC